MAKLSKWDVCVDGIGFYVSFYYTPEEPAILTGPWEDSSPGCPAEVEIESIMIGDVEVLDILNEKTLIAIESKIEEMASEQI
jgi:hypothetical protein